MFDFIGKGVVVLVFATLVIAIFSSLAAVPVMWLWYSF